MTKIITLFVLMIATISFAQNDEAFVDSQVTQKMAGLELQGNSMFFTRKDYCDGNVQMFTMPSGNLCTSKSTYYTVYVFWKEEGDNLKVQKFDNCGSFRTITINGQKILKFLKSKHKELQSQTVKPYKGEEIDENAFDNMEVQSCSKEYRFNLNGASFEKSFNEFDLTNNSKFKNENADYNNSLELISLDKDLSTFINIFENKGKFIREN
ncbi:MAG: hypothetical protein ACTIJ9_08740 [Aequorivita sp.]